MGRTSLILLGLITLGAVAGAAYVLIDRDRVTAPTVGETASLYPKLMDTVNAAATLAARSATESVTVDRTGVGEQASWHVRERGGYPADPGKVKEAVLGTATVQLVETKTANPELFDRLNLLSVDQSGSEAIEITLKDGDGKILAQFLRGKTASFGSGGQQDRFYVRRVGEDQTWLAEGSLDVAADPASWLDRAMPQVAQARVKRVVITHADSELVEIGRESLEQRDFTFLAMPDGMEPKQFTINNTASALDFVSFEDVRPVEDVTFEEPVTARYETFDGLIVTVTITRGDEENWLRFAATADPAAETAVSVVDGGAEGTAAESGETDGDVASEAAQITERYGDWAYRISSYMADRLTRRGEALFEAPEPAAAEGDSETSP